MAGTDLRRTLTLVASAALLASLTAATVATPAAAAADDCRVRNLDKGSVRPTLHKGVKWADPGDRLTVRGTCRGITTIDKNLSITGIRKDGSGKPTLDGDGQGTVLTIEPGVKVSLRDLKVTGGRTSHYGGGVFNDGTLKLYGTTVIRGNQTANDGGGVYNDGTLKLYGTSSIRGNDARWYGGGVGNVGTVKLYGKSVILGNEAEYGGGVYNQGALKLYNKSSVRRNIAPYSAGVRNFGTLAMWGSSSIHHNTASVHGGGLTNFGSLVGVDCGGNIHHNSPNDCDGA